MTTTLYTLEQAAEMLTWPVEALLGVEYDDPRVRIGPGRNEYRLMTTGDWPSLGGPRRELRAAIRRGKPSAEKLLVRVRSVSRGVEGHVEV